MDAVPWLLEYMCAKLVQRRLLDPYLIDKERIAQKRQKDTSDRGQENATSRYPENGFAMMTYAPRDRSLVAITWMHATNRTMYDTVLMMDGDDEQGTKDTCNRPSLRSQS